MLSDHFLFSYIKYRNSIQNMNCRNKSNEFSLFTGVLIGSVISTTIMGIYYNVYKKRKRDKKNKLHEQTDKEQTNNELSDDEQTDNEQTDNEQMNNQRINNELLLNEQMNNEQTNNESPINEPLNNNTSNNISEESHSTTDNNKTICFRSLSLPNILHNETKLQQQGICGVYHCKYNNNKIKEIDKAPLELRKRFNNKGYVFVNQNLATVNTELNEFIELMRKYELHILNGCRDPDTCKCNFRHKYCRLFMMRKYSNVLSPQFYTPTCSGVITIAPSNEDIQNETMIHEFVQMFLNKFLDKVMDLVSYVCYIVDPQRSSEYVVDVTMIADPYDRLQKYLQENRYGKPHSINQSLSDSNSSILSVESTEKECKDYEEHEVIEEHKTVSSSSNTFAETRETTITDVDHHKNHKCSLSWHQDHFIEAKTNQIYAYDFIALFVLNAANVTPHKLMIGKLRNDIDTKDMTLNQLQEYIIPLSDISIDIENSSDIGYVIDQRKRYFHKHSDFEYINSDSRRNVITIRIKYLK
jgi:hypothetical protein